ncbi:MAG TPA: serine/threonine-protein kinase [Thermoanaerobaculaceae bacterium]|nr:serine/threonine-protein kinase [Thermoanaerobaculaceae bacterium]
MHGDSDDRLLELAGRVADGTPVDWKSPTATPELDDTVRNLQALEAVAAAFRACRDEGDATPAAGERSALAGEGREPLFVWGHLEVLEKLGEGSFGEVYRARDPVLDRDVALKLRRAASGEGLAAQAAFLDEARRLARVRHPNVLTVYGADVHDGRAGLWADLITGQTLEERLAQEGPLGAHETALAGIELCDALAAVHAQGLIHGDLKAANVMRERGGRLVLMDFGSVTEAPRCGGAGATLGTPLVTAPEVLRGDTPAATADLYSLGVLLYRLVSGRYPVEADSLMELCDKHARAESVPLADRRSDLPTAFLEVVERALAPSRHDRYQSAGAMRRVLGASLGQAPESEVERADTTSGAPGTSRRRRLLLLALAAGLGLAVPLAAILWQRAAHRPADGAFSGGLRVEATLYREASGRAQLVVPGGSVAPGDRLFLEVESGEPVHVYVLNEDDRGDRFLLFPLAGLDSANPLPAGVRHRLPGRRSGVPQAWEVSSAGGREAFLVVAAREPLPEIEREMASFEAADPARHPRAGEPPPAASGELRGIGGLTGSSAAPAAGNRTLDRLAARLVARQRADGSVWVQQLDLSNPGG